MDSKKLIAMVNESVVENWQGSDICTEGEEMLEKIAEHLTTCSECCKTFNDMDYGDNSLIDFERRLSNSQLSDWICEAVS